LTKYQAVLLFGSKSFKKRVFSSVIL
jgi:hypothetical protein